VAEFLTLVEAALAGQITQTTMNGLTEIQADLRRKQEQITRWFDNGGLRLSNI
jgi:hypothetical protein